MRKRVLFCVLMTIGLIVSGQSLATEVGFNVSGPWGTPKLAGETADGCRMWTDVETNSGSVVISGTAGLVTADWSSGGIWSAGLEDTSEHQLYRIYLDDGSPVSVTFTGLGDWLESIGGDNYMIRIYQNSDWDDALFKPIDITDGTNVLETVQSTNMWHNDGGTRAYVDSGILTADNLTVNLLARDMDAGYRSTLAGVKITVFLNKFTAINPDPAVGTEVPINQILSWEQSPESVGSGVTYDVYFGTDPNTSSPDYYGLTPVKTDTTDLFFDPGVLPNSTTYYWRVNAIDPNNGNPTVHTGPEWWFTTQPASPRIEMDPVSQTVSGGTDEVQFSVSGINIETYQWYKDGVPLADDPTDTHYVGQDSATLTVYDVQVEDEGFYYCEGDNTLHQPDSSAAAQLLTERLVGHWRLDGDLIDSIENEIAGADGHDGVSVDPNYVAIGKDGGALELLGDADGLVRISDSNDFFNFYPRGYTVSVWVNNTQTAGWAAYVAKQQRPELPWKGFVLSQVDGQPVHALRQSGDGDGLYSGGQVADGTWHLVTASYDPAGQESKIYIDGVLRNQLTTTMTPEGNPYPLIFGEEVSEGTVSPYTGLLDDVRIWSYALDPVTVAQLYVDFNPGAEVCTVNPAYDVAGPDGVGDEFRDCKVDLYDFAAFSQDWLSCNIVPTCLQ